MRHEMDCILRHAGVCRLVAAGETLTGTHNGERYVATVGAGGAVEVGGRGTSGDRRGRAAQTPSCASATLDRCRWTPSSR